MDRRYVKFLEALASDWSSNRASTMIDKELMMYTQPRFHRCSSPLKIRIILAILYVPEDVRTECKELLLQIFAEAEVDKDDWVRKLARLVSTFVTAGAIDVRDTDSETAFQILKHIRTTLNEGVVHKPPLDVDDMVNVIGEKNSQLLYDLPDDDDEGGDVNTRSGGFLGSGSYSAFGTTDFRPGLDLKKMTRDLCAHGEQSLIKALQEAGED